MLCGCNSVCFDQEFPGLPPQGDCRRMAACIFGTPRECGCKGECFHLAHPQFAPQRVCRRGNVLAHNATYGKMTGMYPMDAVSKYPDDMIPRITLRDPADAILIIQALRMYQYGRADELQREAKRPGADQIALSLQHIDDTQYIIDLMTAITNGIIPATTETQEN